MDAQLRIGVQALARGRRPEGQPVHEALTMEGEMTREKLQAMKSMQAENELLVSWCSEGFMIHAHRHVHGWQACGLAGMVNRETACRVMPCFSLQALVLIVRCQC